MRLARPRVGKALYSVSRTHCSWLGPSNALHFGCRPLTVNRSLFSPRSGTTWEIECKGVRFGSETLFFIECRRYTTSLLDQESLGGLTYRIRDSGAAVASSFRHWGFKKVPRRSRRQKTSSPLKLNPDSRPELYVARYLDQLRTGIQDRLWLSDFVTLILYDEHGILKERRQGSS